jgi:hypothetical protein
VDLRFHGFQYEGISRHFEMGMDAPFVVQISGHKKSVSLEKYTHVEEVGDKFCEWIWFYKPLASASEL